jgi:hypothetical protein
MFMLDPCSVFNNIMQVDNIQDLPLQQWGCASEKSHWCFRQTLYPDNMMQLLEGVGSACSNCKLQHMTGACCNKHSLFVLS